MTDNEIYEKILLPLKILKRYGTKAQCRCPVNIGPNDMISKLNKILQNSIECRAMLEDILKGGDIV